MNSTAYTPLVAIRRKCFAPPCATCGLDREAVIVEGMAIWAKGRTPTPEERAHTALTLNLLQNCARACGATGGWA